MQKRVDISEDMEVKFDAVDRISELPEFIIHHIMSFLYPKDVVRTSVLSKRWNNLRSSFPILNFDHREFVPNDSTKIEETRKKFITFVDVSLQSFSEQRMCMQKFALNIIWDLKLAPCVDKWVGLVIENNVKELIIKLGTQFNEFYHFPRTVFATKSITTMNLEGCKLELPFGNPIKFRSLQKLCLFRVYVDDDMIRNFVRSCPLIKYFYLSTSWGFKSFHVSGLSYLEDLYVCPMSEEFKEICVEAPRLKSFFFITFVENDPCTINVAASQDLKQLNISYYYMTEELLYRLISKFPNLEELKICGATMLERIAISSHKLKRLFILGCAKLLAAEIDTPNLLLFTYKAGSSMPIFSLMSAPHECEISLNFGNIDSHKFLKLREFLDNLNCRKSLNLQISYEESMFDLEELIGKPLLLPYELEHLTLTVPLTSSNSTTFVDGLFWCCRPKMLSITPNLRSSNDIFIKLLGEKLKDIEARSCCSSSQIRCWLHYLEEVTIESFEGTSNKRFHDWNTFLDALPTLEGQKLCFRFNWCSYLV